MNAGFSQEAYQKATRVRLGSFTFPSFSRAGRGAWPAIHALALRGMSARDASPRFSRNFSIQKKKAKNVCRAIFVMLSWLAAVHIDFAAVSSTVMPLFQMF